MKKIKLGESIAELVSGVNPSKIATGVIKETFSSVVDAVDRFVQNPEEKAQLMLRLKEIEAEKEKVEHENTANARAMNIAVQNSANASWLSKNVGYILDLSAIIIFFVMLIMLFTKQVPQGNEQLFYIALGALFGYVGSVFNYHRGSSIGSERKQATIEQMHRKN